MKKSGHRVETWGTPALILALDEHCPLSTNLCLLFLPKLVKRFNKFLEIPLCCNL